MTRRRHKKHAIASFVSKNHKLIRTFAIFLLALIFVFVLATTYSKIVFRFSSAGITDYKPVINQSDFLQGEANKYLLLRNNLKYRYEKQEKATFESSEIKLLPSSQKPMGISVVMLEKIIKKEDAPLTATEYLLASDRRGDVWLFGQNFYTYEAAKKVKLSKSWIAGIEGAQPGIIIKAEPKPGDSYRTAYVPDKIETVSEVVSVDETVVTPSGTYTSCVKLYDWSHVDPKYQQYKYYCPETGGVALTVDLIDDTREELIDNKVK